MKLLFMALFFSSSVFAGQASCLFKSPLLLATDFYVDPAVGAFSLGDAIHRKMDPSSLAETRRGLRTEFEWAGKQFKDELLSRGWSVILGVDLFQHFTQDCNADDVRILEVALQDIKASGTPIILGRAPQSSCGQRINETLAKYCTGSSCLIYESSTCLKAMGEDKSKYLLSPKGEALNTAGKKFCADIFFKSNAITQLDCKVAK